jgi:hypothetical protein
VRGRGSRIIHRADPKKQYLQKRAEPARRPQNLSLQAREPAMAADFAPLGTAAGGGLSRARKDGRRQQILKFKGR